MIEFKVWYEIKCLNPECNSINWIYTGYWPDPDLGKLDTDSFECWNCKEKFSLIENLNIDNCILMEKGRKEPKAICYDEK